MARIIEFGNAQPVGEADGCYRYICKAWVGVKAPLRLTAALFLSVIVNWKNPTGVKP